ncbi:MAG: hypothetical protein PHN56_05965, partial [Candidatus Nanoarchaeia archaeon]|nr:hypothetical protein [Candidatus Nanoarchaeia archaeon]
MANIESELNKMWKKSFENLWDNEITLKIKTFEKYDSRPELRIIYNNIRDKKEGLAKSEKCPMDTLLPQGDYCGYKHLNV